GDLRLVRLEAVSLVPGRMADLRGHILPRGGAIAEILSGIGPGTVLEGAELHARPPDHARVPAGATARAVGLLSVQRAHGAAPRGHARHAPVSALRNTRLDAASLRALASGDGGGAGSLLPSRRLCPEQRDLRGVALPGALRPDDAESRRPYRDAPHD